MADVVPVPHPMNVEAVVLFGANVHAPETSQSPGVKEIDAAFAVTPVVMATPVAEFLIGSPTLPGVTLLLVKFPTIPAGYARVVAEVA